MEEEDARNSTSLQSPKEEALAQFEFLLVDGALLFLLALAFKVAALVANRRHGHVGASVKDKGFVLALEIAHWSALWFAFSVSLVVYNKWLLHSWEGGFDFPLMISMFHMILKYLLSMAVVRWNRFTIPQIPRKIWWLSAVPVGTATALDVAASNASYLYVSVTFYTIVKSTSLIFTLMFAILYKLQPCSFSLIGSVTVIGAGVAMASFGDVEFSAIGFALVIGASAVGGFRWTLTQVLMRQIRCSLDAILTIYMISPASAMTLVPLSLWLEGNRFVSSKFCAPKLLPLSIANILGSGLFAFAMIFVELELLRRTSSVSLGVISYVKQILQIGFSVLIFGDVLTPLNILGFLCTLAGMFLYTYLKQYDSDETRYQESRREGGLFLFDDNEIDMADDEFFMEEFNHGQERNEMESLKPVGMADFAREDESSSEDEGKYPFQEIALN